MCIGTPKIPAPPVVPERQTPKAPVQLPQNAAQNADRRRRGYAAMMFAGNTGTPSTSGPAITGV